MSASTTPVSSRSGPASFIACAARSASVALRQRIAAQPSGEMTEYVAFSSASTTSPTPRASAPPEPPSPMTTTTTGVASRVMTWMLFAIASP